MTALTSSASAGRWIAVVVILLIGAGCLMGLNHLYAGFRKAPTWDQIFADIAKDFPNVVQTSTDELAEQLASENPPLVVDCRAPEEFRTSRLPGALNLTTVDAVRAASKPGQEIVVYCSVGVRSSQLAQDLNQAGFAKASNLRGSIFQWANEGRDLHAPDGDVTKEVHPFNSRWGTLLDKQ